jgi:hypothetical protein
MLNYPDRPYPSTAQLCAKPQLALLIYPRSLHWPNGLPALRNVPSSLREPGRRPYLAGAPGSPGPWPASPSRHARTGSGPARAPGGTGSHPYPRSPTCPPQTRAARGGRHREELPHVEVRPAGPADIPPQAGLHRGPLHDRLRSPGRQPVDRGTDRLVHQEIREDSPPLPHHRDPGRTADHHRRRPPPRPPPPSPRNFLWANRPVFRSLGLAGTVGTWLGSRAERPTPPLKRW